MGHGPPAGSVAYTPNGWAPIEVVAAPTQLAPPPLADTAQTAAVYQEEARRIVAATPVVRWVQPSRHEAISVAGSELVLATRAEVERVDASPA